MPAARSAHTCPPLAGLVLYNAVVCHHAIPCTCPRLHSHTHHYHYRTTFCRTAICHITGLHPPAVFLYCHHTFLPPVGWVLCIHTLAFDTVQPTYSILFQQFRMRYSVSHTLYSHLLILLCMGYCYTVCHAFTTKPLFLPPVPVPPYMPFHTIPTTTTTFDSTCHYYHSHHRYFQLCPSPCV